MLHLMSMNELNKLKYNLNKLSVLQLNGRSVVKTVFVVII